MAVETLMIVSNPKRSRQRSIHMAKRRQPAALRKYWASHSRKKRSSHRKISYRRRHANPHRRHRRRNPMGLGSVSSVTNKIMPAFIGAASALGADFLLQKTPLGGMVPTMFTTGYLKYLPRAAAVFLAAFIVGKVKPQWRNEALAGGLSIVMYSLLKDVAAGAGVGLADYDDVPDYSTLGYMSPGSQLGAYMGDGRPPRLAGFGYRPPVLEEYMQNYPNSPSGGPIGAYMLNDYNTANLDGN